MSSNICTPTLICTHKIELLYDDGTHICMYMCICMIDIVRYMYRECLNLPFGRINLIEYWNSWRNPWARAMQLKHFFLSLECAGGERERGGYYVNKEWMIFYHFRRQWWQNRWWKEEHCQDYQRTLSDCWLGSGNSGRIEVKLKLF